MASPRVVGRARAAKTAVEGCQLERCWWAQGNDASSNNRSQVLTDSRSQEIPAERESLVSLDGMARGRDRAMGRRALATRPAAAAGPN
jgi:hypothetical protein